MDATHEARRMLYSFEENSRLLENREELARVIREQGSRAQQHHSEHGGRASARYIDSVPRWLEDAEAVEDQILRLEMECIGVRCLLKFLKESVLESNRDLCSIYELRYRDRLPDREIRKRFPKLKQLDAALIAKVAEWCG